MVEHFSDDFGCEAEDKDRKTSIIPNYATKLPCWVFRGRKLWKAMWKACTE